MSLTSVVNSKADGIGTPFQLKNFHVFLRSVHGKDKIQKFRNKYSQKRNIGASVPISTFMCLWANYIFTRPVCLFYWRKYCMWTDPGTIYVNRSQTHECGNWGWGRAIPRKGIHRWDFRCSVPHFTASHKKCDVCTAAVKTKGQQNLQHLHSPTARVFHARKVTA